MIPLSGPARPLRAASPLAHGRWREAARLRQRVDGKRVREPTAYEGREGLPTVRRLAGLWREVRRRPLWAPPNFWRYARLRRRMRLGLVDPDQVVVVGPPAPLGKVNDCRNCLNNCCVGPRATVLLGLRDLAALVDLGRTDLIGGAKPCFDAHERARRPALARLTASRAWQIFPVLRQGALGACRALDAHGRCSLFPDWPLACARFPYALDIERAEAFFSPRCPSYWVRPGADRLAVAMKAKAVAGYNARIQDAILLHYARGALEELGLARFLDLEAAS